MRKDPILIPNQALSFIHEYLEEDLKIVPIAMSVDEIMAKLIKTLQDDKENKMVEAESKKKPKIIGHEIIKPATSVKMKKAGNKYKKKGSDRDHKDRDHKGILKESEQRLRKY